MPINRKGRVVKIVLGLSSVYFMLDMFCAYSMNFLLWLGIMITVLIALFAGAALYETTTMIDRVTTQKLY